MKNKRFIQLAFSLTVAGAIVTPTDVGALDFQAEYEEQTETSPTRVRIKMTGEIEAGDTAKFYQTLIPFSGKSYDQISLIISSKGGSLLEAMQLGRAIASIGISVSAHIGDDEIEKVCASACLYPYLGATYRYLDDDAKIGVHKFFSTSGDDISGSAAMSVAQDLSGMAVAYLKERGVDPSFFSDMVSAHGDDILWVDHDRLREVKIVSQDVIGTKVEYKNIDGNLSLRLEEKSIAGKNVMHIQCGSDGPIMLAVLESVPVALEGIITVISGGEQFVVHQGDDFGVINGKSNYAFQLSREQVLAMGKYKSVGVRKYSSDFKTYFGFIDEVADPRIEEALVTCLNNNAPAAEALSARYSRSMDRDVKGGDLLPNGKKGITLAQCERLCTETKGCFGAAYVTKNQWCWPKGMDGELVERTGVILTIREQ